jgi:multicomponent Na+:H+ antiporter subunit B
MNSTLLQIASRVVVPLQLALSVYFLLRGHNQPGGGFIGGLVASSAFVLLGLAFGYRSVKDSFPVATERLLYFGLLLALISSMFGALSGLPFFTGIWGPEIWLPLVGSLKLGSILLFDIGVFLVVIGFCVGLVFSFVDSGEPQ